MLDGVQGTEDTGEKGEEGAQGAEGAPHVRENAEELDLRAKMMLGNGESVRGNPQRSLEGGVGLDDEGDASQGLNVERMIKLMDEGLEDQKRLDSTHDAGQVVDNQCQPTGGLRIAAADGR